MNEVNVVCLFAGLLSIAGMAQTFAKAGLPRWGAMVPVYNIVLLLRVAQRPVWWLLLLLIPIVNVVVAIVVAVDIARSFGKGAGFGWGLALLGFLFFPILGFGSAVYTPVPKISTDMKQRFRKLGVELDEDFRGTGKTVGIGRDSAITRSDLSELVPFGFDELYLSRTRLGDESIDALKSMPKLRILDVSHTNISRDGINRMKSALPDLTIFG